MMEQLTPIVFKKLISKRLKPLGFELKSSTWVKHQEDSIIGVNLQRSMYSSMHFLNFFIWFPQITQREFLGYLKGCFHLNSRGVASRISVRDNFLLLDGRLVEIEEFESEFEEIFLFSEILIKLFEYSRLDAVGHFSINDYEEETGFHASSELANYLKKAIY